jgi:hypothetical protein
MTRLLACCAALLLAGCAAAPPVITQMSCPTIPAARPAAHVAPLPPVSDTPLVLQPAHWDWVDGSYVWDQPEWVVPPWRGASKWRDGFWTPNGGGCAWTPGHFVV